MNGDELVLALTMMRTWGLWRISDFIQRHHFDVEECYKALETEMYKSEKKEMEMNLKLAHNRIEASRNFEVYFISMFNPFFPEKLYKAIVPCVYLFYMGDITILSEKAAGVFGTTNLKEEFIVPGKRLIKRLLDKNYVIVSGLSFGCEALAMITTVELQGKAIAVLPGSVDVVTPIQHQQLAQDIVKGGGLLVSDYGINEEFNKRHYVRRDCLISTFSDFGVIINDNHEKYKQTENLARSFTFSKKKVYILKGNRLDCFEEIEV